MGQQNPDNVQQTNSSQTGTDAGAAQNANVDNVELAVQLEKVKTKN